MSNVSTIWAVPVLHGQREGVFLWCQYCAPDNSDVTVTNVDGNVLIFLDEASAVGYATQLASDSRSGKRHYMPFVKLLTEMTTQEVKVEFDTSAVADFDALATLTMEGQVLQVDGYEAQGLLVALNFVWDMAKMSNDQQLIDLMMNHDEGRLGWFMDALTFGDDPVVADEQLSIQLRKDLREANTFVQRTLKWMA